MGIQKILKTKKPFNSRFKRSSNSKKEIFRLAGNGMTYYQIKDKLTKDNVPTMCLLRDNKRVGEMSRKGIWSSKTVKGILSNELYLGDMVQK
ncbi:MAG: recombinase family protein [Clostridium sp.]|nr:MAG: recombinase family protein [Clostridium sp.]